MFFNGGVREVNRLAKLDSIDCAGKIGRLIGSLDVTHEEDDLGQGRNF